MQVPDGSIACMTEGSNKPFFRCWFPLLVEGQRMAVTVEGTAEVSTFAYSYVLTDLNVGIENSAHVVLVHSIIYHHSELVPIISITDDDKRRILTDGIAVDKRQCDICRVTRPRFTVVSLSGDAVGVKETVVDGDIAAAVGPAHKTTVAMATVACKTSIELTGADNNIAIIFNGTNETTISSIAIYAAVKSHRRTTVLNIYLASFIDMTNQTSRKFSRRSNSTRSMQAAESSICYVREECRVISII